jgi:hypothetical protein
LDLNTEYKAMKKFLLFGSALLASLAAGVAIATNGTIAVRDGTAQICTTNPTQCGASHNFSVTVDGLGNYNWNYAIVDGEGTGTTATVKQASVGSALTDNALSILGSASPAPTNNASIVIAAPLTYQLLLPAGTRRSLTIQNNQALGTDVCYIIFGQNITSQIVPGTTQITDNLVINGNMIPAGGASAILNPGQPYTRFFPLTQSDPIFIACSTMGDNVYADYQ